MFRRVSYPGMLNCRKGGSNSTHSQEEGVFGDSLNRLDEECGERNVGAKQTLHPL